MNFQRSWTNYWNQWVTNQPTNQPTKQQTNQRNDQPTYLSTYVPTNQLAKNELANLLLPCAMAFIRAIKKINVSVKLENSTPPSQQSIIKTYPVHFVPVIKTTCSCKIHFNIILQFTHKDCCLLGYDAVYYARIVPNFQRNFQVLSFCPPWWWKQQMIPYLRPIIMHIIFWKTKSS